jgi:hypothetical protein
LIAGYVTGSKTEITVVASGNGGLAACSQALSETEANFGGFKYGERFRHFYYCADGVSAMKKGRAMMHKNGTLNVLVGADGEIKMQPNMTEADIE